MIYFWRFNTKSSSCRGRVAIYPPSLEIPHGLLAWISAAPILHLELIFLSHITSHTYIHLSFLVSFGGNTSHIRCIAFLSFICGVSITFPDFLISRPSWLGYLERLCFGINGFPSYSTHEQMGIHTDKRIRQDVGYGRGKRV